MGAPIMRVQILNILNLLFTWDIGVNIELVPSDQSGACRTKAKSSILRLTKTAVHFGEEYYHTIRTERTEI